MKPKMTPQLDACPNAWVVFAYETRTLIQLGVSDAGPVG